MINIRDKDIRDKRRSFVVLQTRLRGSSYGSTGMNSFCAESLSFKSIQSHLTAVLTIRKMEIFKYHKILEILKYPKYCEKS